MALSEGTRIGSYEVLSALGAGGMGEVYRARDARLQRDVALKILPESVATDPERLARFRREAQVLASLNHPHIGAIYGFEESTGVHALVLELVEGPTLADRIAQGPIPIEEALPIARQIAEALEAAHEQGIIHRDLKPANIKLRPDGTVKVLDFGLAKLTASNSPAGAASVSLSPTITSPAMMTGIGVLLGTAAYMSPEQAKGREADKRSDIWAFGCVLYEMLTGRRAFEGEDVSDTLAGVMRGDPDWAKLPDGVPPTLVTFLKSCLRKNSGDRVRDIGDVRLALQGEFDAVAASPAAIRASRPLGRRALPFVVAAITLALGLAVGRWMKPVPPGPVIKAVYPLPGTRTFRGLGRPIVTVSPDGRQFLYNALDGLYIRSVDALSDRLIPGTERTLTSPVFSPDGQSVAFYQDGQIRKIGISGGAAVALARSAPPLGLNWEREGTILYGLADGGLWQISDKGGEPQQLLTSREGEAYANPQRLPGGDWILFTVLSVGRQQSTTAELVVQSPMTGERRTIRSGAEGGRYLVSGHLVYAFAGVLYAAAFDVRRLVSGNPVPVVEGVRSTTGLATLPNFSVSSNGTLVYMPGAVGIPRTDLSVLQADRAGVVTPVNAGRAPYLHIRASPDGSQLAVETDDGNEAMVSIVDVAGMSSPKRLTFGGHNRLPIWSHDGRYVAYQSDRDGDLAIFMQRADGAGGSAERLTTPDKGDVHVPESWSPDGRHISFSVTRGPLSTLWVLSVADRKIAEFGDVHSSEPIGSAFSPDGRWLAYHVRLPGELATAPSSGVFVQPFPATGERGQAPRVNIDFMPVWSRDPRNLELFYVPSTASGQLAAARLLTTSGLRFEPPQLLPFALTAGRISAWTRPFDVLPNGNFVGPGMLESDPGTSAAAREVRVVFNWFEELKRLVPVP